MHSASERLRTIVIEREAPGGQAGTSSGIENYLGFPAGVSGQELASRALQQARRLGAEILVTRAIERIEAGTRQVFLDGGDVLQARTIVIACGVSWRELSADGLDRLAGKASRTGLRQRGAEHPRARRAHHWRRQLSRAGGDVLLHVCQERDHRLPGRVTREGHGRYLADQIASRPNIGALFHSEVVAAHGGESIEAIDVRNSDTGETTRLVTGGLFIFIGADAELAGCLPRSRSTPTATCSQAPR